MRLEEVLQRKPWLLPFIVAVSLGYRRPGEIARVLGVSRRLAASGIYALRRLGLMDVHSVPCVIKWGRFYIARAGSMYVVAKLRQRSVKAYTVPVYVKVEDSSGRLAYRVRIVRKAIEVGEKLGDCRDDG